MPHRTVELIVVNPGSMIPHLQVACGEECFLLMQYLKGDAGADSSVPGPPGVGMPAGGAAGQIAAKASGSDFDIAWVDPSAGAGVTIDGFELEVGPRILAFTPEGGMAVGNGANSASVSQSGLDAAVGVEEVIALKAGGLAVSAGSGDSQFALNKDGLRFKPGPTYDLVNVAAPHRSLDVVHDLTMVVAETFDPDVGYTVAHGVALPSLDIGNSGFDIPTNGDTHIRVAGGEAYFYNGFTDGGNTYTNSTSLTGNQAAFSNVASYNDGRVVQRTSQLINSQLSISYASRSDAYNSYGFESQFSTEDLWWREIREDAGNTQTGFTRLRSTVISEHGDVGFSADVVLPPRSGVLALQGEQLPGTHYSGSGHFDTTTEIRAGTAGGPYNLPQVTHGGDGLGFHQTPGAASVKLIHPATVPTSGNKLVELPRNNGRLPLILPHANHGGSAVVYVNDDSDFYNRHTYAGAKTATFNTAETLRADSEFTITNRSATGNLTLNGTMTLNPPKGGTLVLAPGDTVTVKIIDGTTADVIGSTVPA